MRKIIIVGVLLLMIAMVGCARVEVISGELRIKSGVQDMGLYPAKVLIPELSKEEHIKYRITNYGADPVVVTFGRKFPNSIQDGYRHYSDDDAVWLIIPQKSMEIGTGETYETEIIVGLPKGCELSHPIEFWVGMATQGGAQGIELNSRVLIKK